MTPKQFLEHIKKNVFKDIDLAPATTLQGDELRTFTLEQLERLRGWLPDANAALWLGDQFWTADRNLTMRSEEHPWLADEWEMKDRKQMPDLSDEEYTISCWIEQLALFSHDLYCHEPFDVEQLGDGLQGRFAQTELYADSFRYDNKPLVEWMKTTPYRRIAAMVCYIMADQEIDWAVQNNQARDKAANYTCHTSRFAQCFKLLPEKFSRQQFADTFEIANADSCGKQIDGLIKEGAIIRLKRDSYEKKVVNL